MRGFRRVGFLNFELLVFKFKLSINPKDYCSVLESIKLCVFARWRVRRLRVWWAYVPSVLHGGIRNSMPPT